MEIRVTGRHVEITPAIKDYAEKKVAKLPRYFDRISMIEVFAGKHDKNHFEAEIVVEAEHSNRFVAKDKNEDLYASIDGAVDKLERQLSDHKDRVRNHKGHTSMSG